jgi:Rod binding domain-containing protein
MEIGANTPALTAIASDTTTLRNIVHNDTFTEEQKIAEMSRQFESVLVKQFLEDGMKPIFKGMLDESTAKHAMYRSLFTDALANNITQSSNFGFASALQAQLQPKAADNGTTK